MSGIRTPLNTTPAFALGNKKWVKEILRVGPLHYEGKVFDVTPEYLDTVADSYRDGAIKRVPFQLAGKNNEHDESPERRRGFIEGVWREGDKLKSVISLEDEANHLVETDSSFPVSVLIKHDRTKGNTGQHWGAVLTHVLGTYDPVLDLDDWEPYVAASNQDADVIDFLALSAPDGQGQEAHTSSDEGDTNPSEGTTDMPSLTELLSNASEDELRDLRSRLDTIAPAADPTDPATAAAAAPAPEDDADLTDAELDEALAALGDDDLDGTDDDPEPAPVGDPAPAPVAAGHPPGDDALALANAQMTEQLTALRTSQAQMQARLNDADWNERAAAYARAGVPRVLVDRARPALHGNDQTLALSQSDRAKTSELVDGLLLETGKLLAALGLSHGTVGTVVDTPADQAEAEQRSTAVAGHLAAAGMTRPARS